MITLPSGSLTKPMWQTPESSMPIDFAARRAELLDRFVHVCDAEPDPGLVRHELLALALPDSRRRA